MTATAVYVPDQPLTHAERRASLLAAAAIRHRHPFPAAVMVRIDAPNVPADQRWDWLDRLAALADRLALLDRVGSDDDARHALFLLNEGPWFEALDEARTLRDEADDDIDRLITEATA